MSRIDQLLSNARGYARMFDKPNLPIAPRLGVAVVACEDARINVYGILGLTEGDAHVLCNAGGVVTDDVIRSLAISQRVLGTSEIMVIHHANCEMRSFRDEEFMAQIEAETGIRPAWNSEAFTDAVADVRQSIRRIKTCPFLPHTHTVRGFVYNERTGRLTEVADLLVEGDAEPTAVAATAGQLPDVYPAVDGVDAAAQPTGVLGRAVLAVGAADGDVVGVADPLDGLAIQRTAVPRGQRATGPRGQRATSRFSGSQAQEARSVRSAP
jgi:carbonic anhydrase